MDLVSNESRYMAEKHVKLNRTSCKPVTAVIRPTDKLGEIILTQIRPCTQTVIIKTIDTYRNY